MAYITETYYNETFNGAAVENFERLADMASEIIKDVCTQEISDEDAASDNVMLATAYQVEYMSVWGGVTAALDTSANAGKQSESLGGYSVTYGNGSNGQNALGNSVMWHGIPVSPFALNKLRNAGLLSRWLLSKYYRSQQL